MLDHHEVYMRRCLQLAKAGAGYVAPNPMVGAVLVHDGQIIAEGYHQLFGSAHAEVNCLNSVPAGRKHVISESTLYVSLEPCNHFGKTPPCTDLILSHRIPRVVIGCKDPFEKVNGSGIERLLKNGVDVSLNVLEKEALDLNKRFFCFHQQNRPYIILKWAQDAQGIIAVKEGRTKISNEITDRLVHKWRAEEAAIMVGTNTALVDDPSLTTRHWPGKNPVRIVVDRQLRIPATANVFNDDAPTIILNEKKESASANLAYCRLNNAGEPLSQIVSVLHAKGLLSVIIEGGSLLLQSFINAGLWDEARVITNTRLTVGKGITAPTLPGANMINTEFYRDDRVDYYKRVNDSEN